MAIQQVQCNACYRGKLGDGSGGKIEREEKDLGDDGRERKGKGCIEAFEEGSKVCRVSHAACPPGNMGRFQPQSTTSTSSPVCVSFSLLVVLVVVVVTQVPFFPDWIPLPDLSDVMRDVPTYLFDGVSLSLLRAPF